MAYMKKMRKTKINSKKNVRKTKRIRGGMSSEQSNSSSEQSNSSQQLEESKKNINEYLENQRLIQEAFDKQRQLFKKQLPFVVTINHTELTKEEKEYNEDWRKYYDEINEGKKLNAKAVTNSKRDKYNLNKKLSNSTDSTDSTEPSQKKTKVNF